MTHSNTPVEIVIGKPPHLEDIKKHFPKVDTDEMACAYGDKIYIPHEVSKDILIHEMAHCDRQGFTEDGAKAWWDRYFTDAQFRYGEELHAYRMQYQFYKRTIHDKNSLFKFGAMLASYLSGPFYGGLVSHQEAYKKITS